MRVVVVDGAVTQELRRAVLRPSWAPGSALPGDDEPGVVHLAALAGDGTALGACLVFPEECPWQTETPGWRLRSMAVAPAAQGTGVGRMVLDAAVGHARAAGGRLLWCHARETAAGFYLRAGWHDRSTPAHVYDDEATGLPHRDMYRVL